MIPPPVKEAFKKYGFVTLFDHVRGLFASPTDQNHGYIIPQIAPGQTTQVLNLNGYGPGWSVVLTCDAQYTNGRSPTNFGLPIVEFEITYGTGSAFRRRLTITSPSSVCLPATSLQVSARNISNQSSAFAFGVASEAVQASCVTCYGSTSMPARWIVSQTLAGAPNPSGTFQIPPLATVALYGATANTVRTSFEVRFGFDQTVGKTREVTALEGQRINVPIGACSMSVRTSVAAGAPFHLLVDGEVVP